eukprot:gene3146-3877_t
MKNNELDLLAPKFGNFSAPTPEHLLMKNQEAIPVNIKLFKAALAGSIAGVQDALIQGGKPDFFFRQEDSKNALHVASESGYLDIVQVLLSHGAVPDCRVASTKDTALILATASGQDEVVEALIGAGAKVNTSKGDLFAPGRLDFIEELLLSGANPNVKDNLKQSGYDIARFYNQDGVVDKLFPSTTETRAAGAV